MSMESESGIVLLCSDGDSTRAIYNALERRFGPVPVVMEDAMSRIDMAKRRANKLGYTKVLGQMLFVAVAVPVLAGTSRKRIREIEEKYGLQNDWGGAAITRVSTVNSDETIGLLRSMR